MRKLTLIVFALTLNLALSGCRPQASQTPPAPAPTPVSGQPQPAPAPIPSPSNCPKDSITCPDGTVLRRQGPLCLFPSCPQTQPTVTCPTDTKPCEGGLLLHRLPPKCDFPLCPSEAEAKRYPPLFPQPK